MIFERRAYTMEPGHVEAFDQAQLDRGFDLVKPYMERLVGYFSTRTGPADQVVHLYRYDGLDDWNTRLRGLYSVPELSPYFVNTRKIVRHQVNGFYELLPLGFLNPLWGGGNDWLPEMGKTLAPLTSRVVIEERSFQLKPGGIPSFVDLCKTFGESALTCMEGRIIGAFMSMIGPLHNVALWWWFEDVSEREARHDVLRKSAEWQEFTAAISPVVIEQSSIIMVPRPVPEMSPLFA